MTPAPGAKMKAPRGGVLVRAADEPDLPDRARPREAAGAVEGRRRPHPLRARAAAAAGPGGGVRLQPRDDVHDRPPGRSRTLLERFKPMHEQVDYEIGLQMSGLAAVYGSKAIPRSLQGKIDALFAGSGLLASQRLDQADAAASRVEEDARRQIDAQIQQQTEKRQGRDGGRRRAAEPDGVVGARRDSRPRCSPTCRWRSSSSSTAQTLQDLGQHLRRHRVPPPFRRREAHRLLHGARADVCRGSRRTSCWPRRPTTRAWPSTPSRPAGSTSRQTGGALAEGRWNQTFAFKTLRTIAELTGGVSSIAESGATAMDRINDVTRSGYLLGYYPTNANWDGSYRKVEVKVSRPGVTVLLPARVLRPQGPGDVQPARVRHRRPRSGRPRRSAGRSRTSACKVDASVGTAEDGRGYELSVSVNIDPSKLAFTFVEGTSTSAGSASPCSAATRRATRLGNSMQTADLKLKDELLQADPRPPAFRTRCGSRSTPPSGASGWLSTTRKPISLGSADKTLRWPRVGTATAMHGPSAAASRIVHRRLSGLTRIVSS